MAKRVAREPEPAAELTWEQALAWRMRRHQLVERAPRRSLIDVVDRVCGLHAQVMSSAELTVWVRVDGIQPDTIGRALWKGRTLVKLWAMRGTLHLLPAHELGVWLGALATYEHYLKPVWLRAFDITREQLEALIAAIGEALEGRILTREELGEDVQRITRSPGVRDKVQGSWGPYLKPASFRGLLCFGPSDGQRVRFTAPATWVKGELEIGAPDDALLQITRRYLGAFAPARREDLARWWSVQPAPAGRMLAALGDDVVPVDVEGTAAWMLREHADQAAAARPVEVARLLPAFDPWVVGAARDAPALLDPPQKQRVYRNQGWLSPVLLVNGRMEGTWRHERKGRRLMVQLEPFGRLPKWARAQLEAEAERLEILLGGELTLVWSR